MIKQRSFWVTLCLANLPIVAFFGFCLRSKILFSLPIINYRDFESAHSHFAFAGWAGLSLITLMIFDLLPENKSRKNIYSWILCGIEISSLGMAATFPIYGYNAVSIFFSTLYIVATVVFAPVFIRDILRSDRTGTAKLLSISAITSLIMSFSGTIGLIYILIARSGNSTLYRDSIYTFLHFQYNGFFTLAAFALFFDYISRKHIDINRHAKIFSLLLCLSVPPALFLSLLWHNNSFFYLLAGIGCILIISCLIYLFGFYRKVQLGQFFSSRMARTFISFAFFSFCLKMLLNVGTIFPRLGNAVYGDRPVIIGFLHLVFLGFITFFLLANFIENKYFIKRKMIAFPFYLFAAGIFLNELFLAIQGLGILFQTNSGMFAWLLWGTSILLFSGALFIFLTRIYVTGTKKPLEREPNIP